MNHVRSPKAEVSEQGATAVFVVKCKGVIAQGQTFKVYKTLVVMDHGC